MESAPSIRLDHAEFFLDIMYTVLKRSILINLIFSPEPSGMVAKQQGSIRMRNFGIVDTSPSVLVRILEVFHEIEKTNQGPINRPLKSLRKCRGSMSSRKNSSTSLVSFSSLSFLKKKLKTVTTNYLATRRFTMSQDGSSQRNLNDLLFCKMQYFI